MLFSDLFSKVIKDKKLTIDETRKIINRDEKLAARKSIWNWTSGSSIPNVNKAAKIAKELDFSLDDLK